MKFGRIIVPCGIRTQRPSAVWGIISYLFIVHRAHAEENVDSYSPFVTSSVSRHGLVASGCIVVCSHPDELWLEDKAAFSRSPGTERSTQNYYSVVEIVAISPGVAGEERLSGLPS